MDKIVKAFSSDITVVEGERAVSARISTSAVDRDGDVLVPQGCNYKNFQKNPVVFWNHDAWNYPVGKCVAFKKGDEYIDAKVVFASRPENHPEGEEWEPDTIFALYQQKVLNAFSVGLIPTETRPPTTRDIEKYGECSRIVSKWELYEFSAVPLPANQEAVALAVSKGCKQDEAEAWLAGHKPKAVAATVRESLIVESAAPVQKKIIKHHIAIIRRPVDVEAMTRDAVKRAVAKAMGRIYQD